MAEHAVAVTLEQYLATDYRPDVEYLDGELKERGVVSAIHGRVQSLLGFWFGQYEEDWNVQALVEARTKVNDHAVRLPDVTVMAAGPLPKRALVEAPLLVIEVLSKTDREADLKSRAMDLASMGTENIWLLDPEARSAKQWVSGAWQPFEGTLLGIADSPVYLDLTWLWKKLGPQG